MTVVDTSTSVKTRKRAASPDVFSNFGATNNFQSTSDESPSLIDSSFLNDVSVSVNESEYNNHLTHAGDAPGNGTVFHQRPTTKSKKAVATGSNGVFTSIYRGVSLHKTSKKYEAHFWDANYKRETTTNKSKRSRGKQMYLGSYVREEDAARAYDRAALAYLGNKAVTNFPADQYKNFLSSTAGKRIEEIIGEIRRGSVGFSRGRSKYRGISKHTKDAKWEARFGKNDCGKYEYLGVFNTEEDAARAYDLAAIKAKGFNAVTNFPFSDYSSEITAAQPFLSFDHFSSFGPLSHLQLPPAIMMQHIPANLNSLPHPQGQYIMMHPFFLPTTTANTVAQTDHAPQQQSFQLQWMPTAPSLFHPQGMTLSPEEPAENSNNGMVNTAASMTQHLDAMNHQSTFMPCYEAFNHQQRQQDGILQELTTQCIDNPTNFTPATNTNHANVALPDRLLSTDNEDILGTLQWLDSVDLVQLLPNDQQQQQSYLN